MTLALVSIVKVRARSGTNWSTWVVGTLVDFSFALQANKPRATLTHKAISHIETSTTVLTWFGVTSIDFVLTTRTNVTILTIASEPIDKVYAFSRILTR